MKKSAKGRAYIGTSGWSYGEWRDNFYTGVPQKHWLRFCAERFTAIEVNGTFYHQLPAKTFKLWKETTPADFRFAVKGNRYLTHVKRFDPPLSSVTRQREEVSGLGEKLAAMLWQAPQSLQKDLARLDDFAAKLQSWRETRHVIEFRHASWFNDEVAEHMSRFRLAACQSDSADWPMWETVTTDLVYIRLHGHSMTYVSNYTAKSLQRWAKRAGKWLAEGRDVHIYFDNTASGNAPRNALALLEMLRDGQG